MKAPQDCSATFSPKGISSVRPKPSFKYCGAKNRRHPKPPAIKRCTVKTNVRRDAFSAYGVDEVEDEAIPEDDISIELVR